MGAKKGSKRSAAQQLQLEISYYRHTVVAWYEVEFYELAHGAKTFEGQVSTMNYARHVGEVVGRAVVRQIYAIINGGNANMVMLSAEERSHMSEILFHRSLFGFSSGAIANITMCLVRNGETDDNAREKAAIMIHEAIERLEYGGYLMPQDLRVKLTAEHAAKAAAIPETVLTFGKGDGQYLASSVSSMRPF